MTRGPVQSDATLPNLTDFGMDTISLAGPLPAKLADFMWQEIHSIQERMETARHFRVFPGEGVHSDQLARLVRAPDRMGYEGDYGYEVSNDDYQQMPLEAVCARARRSSIWLAETVLRRAAPLPEGPRWLSA